jgi:predicted lipoprotein with Yx(FWY)xxD motif
MRIALVIVPAALALAGVSATTALGHQASAAASKHAVVKTRHGALGTFLVDGKGRTLYLFKKDTTSKSRCTGMCASDWPPLTTKERPEAEGGAKQRMLSTSRRAGGAKQVVYHGHPLYHFAFDNKAGDTNGEGVFAFGARWYVVSASGKAITPAGAATPSPTSTPTPTPYPY